jgi:hypothetical protein
MDDPEQRPVEGVMDDPEKYREGVIDHPQRRARDRGQA